MKTLNRNELKKFYVEEFLYNRSSIADAQEALDKLYQDGLVNFKSKTVIGNFRRDVIYIASGLKGLAYAIYSNNSFINKAADITDRKTVVLAEGEKMQLKSAFNAGCNADYIEVKDGSVYRTNQTSRQVNGMASYSKYRTVKIKAKKLSDGSFLVRY